MIRLTKKNIWWTPPYKSKEQKVDNIVPYLNDPIEIGKSFTLEDFFNIFKKDVPLYELIFSSHLYRLPLQPYFDEISKHCSKKDKNDLDYIEIIWETDQFTYKGKTDVNIGPGVYGWGKIEKNEENKWMYKKGETHCSYGIEYLPLNQIKHLPIVLNEELEIYPEWSVKKDIEMKKKIGEKATKKYFFDTPIINGEKSFTVFEVFGELLFELSWAGTPEQRDEQIKGVVKVKEEYEERTKKGEKFPSFDELVKKKK